MAESREAWGNRGAAREAEEHVTAALASQHTAWPPNVMHHLVSQAARELGNVTPTAASRLGKRERAGLSGGKEEDRQRVSHSFLQTVSTEQNREQPAASVLRFRPCPSGLYPERRDARLTFPCLLLVAL